jgi:short-subunit dehydrogenase
MTPWYVIVRKTASDSVLPPQLTARDEGRGRAAVEEIKQSLPSNARVEYAQLDISSNSSIEALSLALKERHPHIDILVNNAGIVMDGFDGNIAHTTISTNYTATKHVRIKPSAAHLHNFWPGWAGVRDVLASVEP